MPSDLSRACSIPFYDNDGFLVANSLDCVGPYEAAPCRACVSVGGGRVSLFSWHGCSRVTRQTMPRELVSESTVPDMPAGAGLGR